MKHSISLESLIKVTSRLGELIGQENEILVRRRAHELAATQAEKENLVSAYEREIGALRSQPDAVGKANAEALTRLQSATKRFQEVMEEHRRLVQSAKSVSDRMIRNITDEIAQKQRPVTGYTAGARMNIPVPRAQKPVSLALNQLV